MLNICKVDRKVYSCMQPTQKLVQFIFLKIKNWKLCSLKLDPTTFHSLQKERTSNNFSKIKHPMEGCRLFSLPMITAKQAESILKFPACLGSINFFFFDNNNIAKKIYIQIMSFEPDIFFIYRHKSNAWNHRTTTTLTQLTLTRNSRFLLNYWKTVQPVWK